MTRIYWASPLFTEAQRQFNADWASALRDIGFEVILPQEFAANDPSHSPTATEIFATDTAEVLQCDALVAVVDDETIDSGVATEVGIAHAVGRAVVGVYTDIRRDRAEGRMYKNLYVLGLIESSLGVVHTKDDLVESLSGWRQDNESKQKVVRSPAVESSAADLDSFVHRLEQRYQPTWSSYDSVIESLEELAPTQVIDFGCGTGRLAQRLANFGLAMSYFGYDPDSRQIEIAAERRLPDTIRFSSIFTDLIEVVRDREPDRLLNISFVLHDLEDLADLRAVGCFLPSNHVLIHDLCVGDLPRVTELLSLAAGKPVDAKLDRRLSIERLQELSTNLRFKITRMEPISVKVTFPDRTELLSYCTTFGLLEGHDIPIATNIRPDILRENFERLIDRLDFPIQDQRLFAKVVAVIE
jgi:nucleoside 2-deoxyribosyltransferase/SAM-dependent methyltransferase